MSDIKDLDTLVPDEVYVTIKGEQIEIRPFKFLNLLKVLKILFKMMEGFSLELLDQFSIVKMLAENPDDMLKVFSLATGKPEKFFDDIDADEGVDVITTIYKTNQDFFVRKLRPKLEKLNALSNSQESQMISEQLQSDEEQEQPPKNKLEITTEMTE